jgi:PPM family protein phosphatase
MSTRASLDLGCTTDAGRHPTRQHNEDAGGFHRTGSGGEFVLAAVADGMGGMQRGAEASAAALSSFLSADPSGAATSADSLVEWARYQCKVAHCAVRDALGTSRGGTTLTGVVFSGNRFVLAHVGDCRAYLWSATQFVRITNDHSLAAALVAAGQVAEHDAGADRSTLLRSLGVDDDVPEAWIDDLSARGAVRRRSSNEAATWTRLMPGEVLLLVTDGVWGVVSDDDAATIVRTRATAQSITDALIAAALEGGGPDNATAVAVRCLEP